MAVMHYLMGVLLLSVMVSGQVLKADDSEWPQSTGPKSILNYDTLRPLLEKAIQNPYLCKACEGVIALLKNVTCNQENLDELVKTLLPVCDLAPYVLHEDCIKYIESIPAMVKELADEYLDPEKVCAMLCQGPGPEMMIKTNAIPTGTELVEMLKMAQRKPVN